MYLCDFPGVFQGLFPVMENRVSLFNLLDCRVPDLGGYGPNTCIQVAWMIVENKGLDFLSSIYVSVYISGSTSQLYLAIICKFTGISLSIPAVRNSSQASSVTSRPI